MKAKMRWETAQENRRRLFMRDIARTLHFALSTEGRVNANDWERYRPMA
jgi:hypothetical protein